MVITEFTAGSFLGQRFSTAPLHQRTVGLPRWFCKILAPRLCPRPITPKAWGGRRGWSAPLGSPGDSRAQPELTAAGTEGDHCQRGLLGLPVTEGAHCCKGAPSALTQQAGPPQKQSSAQDRPTAAGLPGTGRQSPRRKCLPHHPFPPAALAPLGTQFLYLTSHYLTLLLKTFNQEKCLEL